MEQKLIQSFSLAHRIIPFLYVVSFLHYFYSPTFEDSFHPSIPKCDQ